MRHSVRTKAQRRTQAIAQAKEYSFANSKAARKGVSEEKWKEGHNARLAHLEGITTY
jgi:hypothetical protein|tara:strand:- start:261 stop:431 length:171 start_codon:yes stop_codon:yes gene_type:complete